jgi:hypothetical protein
MNNLPTKRSNGVPNKRSALDARIVLCLYIEDHWPGASESQRWAARMLMHTIASLTVVGLLLVCACAGEKEMRFTKGTGDMGHFLMQQALKRGARPVATNSLPVVAGDWSYSEDQYGVVLHLPRERFSEIEVFLQQAFGAPAQQATDTKDGGKLGWYSPKAIGVALQFGCDSNVTQVIVLRPQPASEIIKRIPEAIERSGK